MEGKHIQLPYGVLSDDEPRNLLHFNLLPNYKMSVLWQTGESQNGGKKNTKYAKFSEKRTFFTP